jgi:hypothetical protein
MLRTAHCPRSHPCTPHHTRPTATQLRCAILESGFEVRQGWGEADAALAHMLQSLPSESEGGIGDSRAFSAILAKDSDFFVFRGCRCVPFETVEVDRSTGRISVSGTILVLGMPWTDDGLSVMAHSTIEQAIPLKSLQPTACTLLQQAFIDHLSRHKQLSQAHPPCHPSPPPC